MNFIAIIPARYGSSRFPGKPLAILGGKPVIQRVVEQAEKVLTEVYVATDDERIYETVQAFGGKAVMTRSDHQSGTDRIKEALDIITGKQEYSNQPSSFQPLLSSYKPDVVINIQGDEPFIQMSQIQTVMNCFNDSSTQIATLGKHFTTIDAAKNPNSPKIVLDSNSYAMYFSRSVIPFVRGKEESKWISAYPFLKHIGLYAYRTDILAEITQLPPSSLEKVESLEQLRWLQNGYKVKVGLTDVETVGIDTPEDLAKAEQELNKSAMGKS